MSISPKISVRFFLVTCLIAVCLAKVNIIDIPRKTIFNVAVLRNQKPVVVFFTKSTCTVCRFILDDLEDIARQNDNDMYLARVYVDQYPELKEEFGIDRIPTTRIYFKGEVQRELKGPVKPAIIDAANDALKLAEQSKKRY